MKKVKEENPFEDEKIANEWIRSVEGESGYIRDNDIYPRLAEWGTEIKNGLIVEIGSGQGICSDKLGSFNGRYIGVEPSKHLTKRAHDLYGKKSGYKYVVGSAYSLPVENARADAAFSVIVWIHLEDLHSAVAELFRILKRNGKFLIITANPNSYDLWDTFYEKQETVGKKVTGTIRIPINPLTKQVFYKHSLAELKDSLESESLHIDSISELGVIEKDPNTPLFIDIRGHKI